MLKQLTFLAESTFGHSSCHLEIFGCSLAESKYDQTNYDWLKLRYSIFGKDSHTLTFFQEHDIYNMGSKPSKVIQNGPPEGRRVTIRKTDRIAVIGAGPAGL